MHQVMRDAGDANFLYVMASHQDLRKRPSSRAENLRPKQVALLLLIDNFTERLI
jgi:hypothetical protein